MAGSTDRMLRQTSTPLPSGKPAVEYRDVGAQGGDAALGFDRRAGLTHDNEVVLGLEQVTKPSTDDFVVVEQEDPDPALGISHASCLHHRLMPSPVLAARRRRTSCCLATQAGGRGHGALDSAR